MSQGCTSLEKHIRGSRTVSQRVNTTQSAPSWTGSPANRQVINSSYSLAELIRVTKPSRKEEIPTQRGGCAAAGKDTGTVRTTMEQRLGPKGRAAISPGRGSSTAGLVLEAGKHRESNPRSSQRRHLHELSHSPHPQRLGPLVGSSPFTSCRRVARFSK